MPAKTAQRQTVLRKLKDSPATLVIYEAPHRIRDTVRTLADIFEPSRTVVIARELTKLFEEIHRCPLSEAIPWLEENRNRQKGEFVLLVQGAPSREDDESQARHILSVLLDELPAGTAAGLTAKITGIRKNRLYDMALELKKKLTEKKRNYRFCDPS